MNDGPSPALGPSYLRPGERVLWFGKPTLRSVISLMAGLAATILFFLLTGSASLLTGQAPAVLALLPLFLLGLGTVAVLAVVRLRRTEYVITQGAVYTRTGIIGTRVAQTTYDKITDIQVNQDVWGRLFGYGALQVNTAGSAEAPIQMAGLLEPFVIKGILERAKEEALAGRGRTRGGRDLPYFTPRDQIANFRCPSCGRSFPRPATDAGRRVRCPHCAKTVRLPEVTRAAPRRR